MFLSHVDVSLSLSLSRIKKCISLDEANTYKHTYIQTEVPRWGRKVGHE